MKGQVAIVLILSLLVTGVIAFLLISLIFVPILKSIVTTPVLDPPAVGAITALLGFLPDQCSILTSLECRFCLITNKIVPFVVNFVFGIILFSVLLRFIGGPSVGWEGAKEAKGKIPGGLGKDYGLALLISITFSIFMLHQPDSFAFISPITFSLAIIVRVLAFMVDVPNIGFIRGITDFFLAAYILIFGWANWFWIPIFILVGLIFGTAVTGGQPNVPITQLGIFLIFSALVGVYVYGIFEFQWWTPLGTLPTKIEFHGLENYIIEKANLPDIKCGLNNIGPESSISI